MYWAKRFFLLSCMFMLVLAATPANAHNMPVGGSKWCAGKNGLLASIDLNETLFSELRGIREKQYHLASGSESQLQQIAKEFVQPYIDQELSVTINGKPQPVRVEKLVRNDNSTYTIWLSARNALFDRPQNTLKIDYRMLFEETRNMHMNLAYFYRTDATGEALQKFLDYHPADGEHEFNANSKTWEFTVQGPAAAPAVKPVAAAAQPAVKSDLDDPGEGRVLLNANHAARNAGPVVPAGPDREAVTSWDGSNDSSAENPHAPRTMPAPAVQSRPAVAAAPAPPLSRTPAGAAPGRITSPWSIAASFIPLGIEHILTGYDHIAFLLGLIVIGLSVREVLKVITAFTLAHSITLLLAALQVISLNSRFVESVIAISICYIALENLFKKEVKYRWVITFCFGLIHGFGFASALQELIVGKPNLVVSVISFNLGVEAGQLMIFFILLPVLYLLKQRIHFRRITAAVSVAILVLGFTWLIERLFDLKLISS
ncbi:HupE/UreJ family protein [Geomesophilobacter sediminis]|uniref:HupE/UreJ family protein n=1 Tax=Geomesophilobacter sediminis TaxID=2798584 RepID=A0A8J7LU49_9BACT|nr:HupE/UreJ family protein [Geomesophilobacter sediminis]MBJ6724229.1 HupE/UreJ family protein [Geomesophilobacter sediminis]